MTIIMQGGVWEGTLKTAEYYCTSPYVEKVIISILGDEEIKTDNPLIEIVKSKEPYPGQGNMNFQIVSSLAGVKRITNAVGIKTRTDQRLTHDTLYKIMMYFLQNSSNKPIRFHDNSGYATSEIFVIGNQSRFPFQPQDHIFMGYKQDLINLFSIPLNKEPTCGDWTKPEWGKHKQRDVGLDFSIHLRMPIYLGAFYYARFDKRVRKFIREWQTYLLDDAPKQAEAMEVYDELRDKIFKPFPKFIDMYWEKYKNGYPYQMYEDQGEYYGI